MATVLLTCWPECSTYNNGIPNCCESDFVKGEYTCTCVPVGPSNRAGAASNPIQMMNNQAACNIKTAQGVVEGQQKLLNHIWG